MIRAVLLASAAVAFGQPASAQLVPAIAPASAQEVAPPPQQPTSQPGPTAQNGQAPQFIPAGPPPSLPAMSADRPLARREAVNVAAASRWRRNACSPTRRPDGVLAFRQGACEITVVCAPFRVCDVALMPGETPTSTPSVGDPRVGLQSPKFSGSAADRTVHLVFQPSDAGLSSSVVLHTDRRTVTLLVVTRQHDYMPLVALDDGASASGPSGWASLAVQGAAAGPRDPCDAAPTIPPSQYRISVGGIFGAAPEWKPTQVYGVALPGGGPATCIEFPADITSLDAPILVPRDAAGNGGVDNVRTTARRYRVDRSVSRFDLLSGIGWDQQRVSVRRK